MLTIIVLIILLVIPDSELGDFKDEPVPRLSITLVVLVIDILLYMANSSFIVPMLEKLFL